MEEIIKNCEEQNHDIPSFNHGGFGKMMERKIKIKNFKEIWKTDQRLLASCNPGVEYASAFEFPNDRLLYSYLVKRTEILKNPPAPVELTNQIVIENAEKLMGEIENCWKIKVKQRPAIEIHKSVGYMVRISQLEDEINSLTGSRMKCAAPPSAYYSAYQDVLLLPDNFLARQPKHNTSTLETSVYKDNWINLEFRWDKPYFEVILADQLAKVLFRQIRNETKEGYLDMVKRIGRNAQEITELNGAMGLYTAQQLAINNHPGWGFYVLADRIISVWGNSNQRASFLGVDALVKDKTLHQIAMLDFLKADEKSGIVHYDFFESHPRHKEKKRRFEEALEK